MDEAVREPTQRPGLLAIFGAFAKIGGLSFGGPYAILSYIEKEVVERRRWISAEEFARGVGIGHLTPGPIAFSSAVYAGHRLRGWRGSTAAAIGLVLPSFVIAVAFAIGYSRIAGIPGTRPVIAGFNAAVIGLLISIVIKMAKGVARSWPKVLLALGAFVLLVLKVNPAFIVLGSALVALAFGALIVPAKVGGDAK
jgi:chromate transporter